MCFRKIIVSILETKLELGKTRVKDTCSENRQCVIQETVVIGDDLNKGFGLERRKEIDSRDQVGQIHRNW